MECEKITNRFKSNQRKKDKQLMGCLSSSATVSKGSESKPRILKKQSIEMGKGNKQQGVHELKQNYHIDSKTKVLGVGAFGRVFLTTNKHDKNL